MSNTPEKANQNQVATIHIPVVVHLRQERVIFGEADAKGVSPVILKVVSDATVGAALLGGAGKAEIIQAQTPWIGGRLASPEAANRKIFVAAGAGFHQEKQYFDATTKTRRNSEVSLGIGAGFGLGQAQIGGLEGAFVKTQVIHPEDRPTTMLVGGINLGIHASSFQEMPQGENNTLRVSNSFDFGGAIHVSGGGGTHQHDTAGAFVLIAGAAPKSQE